MPTILETTKAKLETIQDAINANTIPDPENHWTGIHLIHNVRLKRENRCGLWMWRITGIHEVMLVFRSEIVYIDAKTGNIVKYTGA